MTLLTKTDFSVKTNEKMTIVQGSKIALVRSHLQVPQAAGQVKILIFLLKIKFPPPPIYANNFCHAGQVSAYFQIFPGL